MVKYTEKQLEELKTIIYKMLSNEKGYVFRDDDVKHPSHENLFGNLRVDGPLLDPDVLIRTYIDDLFKRLKNNEEKVEPENIDIELPLSDLEIAIEGDFEDLPMAINAASPLSEAIMRWRMDKGI